MNKLKKDIENFLSCNQKMGEAKNNIIIHFKNYGLPSNCTDNAITYLEKIQRVGQDIDNEINVAFTCFANINCTGKNPCTCFSYQALTDILKLV